MPATEQTWRNQKLLHVVFAVSTLIMMIATVWLLAGDHLREWKKWQLTDRKKDAWTLQARHDKLAAQNAKQMAEFEAKLRVLDSQEISAKTLSDFKASVESENQRLKSGGSGATSGKAPAEEEAPPTTQLEKGQFEEGAITLAAYTTDSPSAEFARLDEAASQLVELARKAEDLRAAATKAAADAAAAAKAEGAVKEGEAKIADPEAIAAAQETARSAEEEARVAEEAAHKQRAEVLKEMDKFIREARRRELRLVSEKKTVNGLRTAVVSELGIAVGEGKPKAQIDEIQKKINDSDAKLAKLTEEIAAAKDYRLRLEALVAQASTAQAALIKSRDDINTELSRIEEQVYKNTTHPLEWVTRWPVLNALYNGNIRIEQNWLPDLTINYNFAQAARFDRCTTCHRAISKTAAGTATDAEYPTLPDAKRDLEVLLPTPAEAPGEGATLQSVYGLELSPTGIVRDGDVTIHFALPDTPAARVGLQSGDVLKAINGLPVLTPEAANEQLLTLMKWGTPAKLSIRRGLDHPFTGHPRLDLYLTDLSPHPQKDVGCTICHDGQGSGTSFMWTSHTPDNPDQQSDWIKNYGWFDNHHWIFPMKPARFVESNCLKCHHDKGGLEPSERFPEPPAPKLVAGWTTVEKYGCFGCHEINGFDGPKKTVGPDVRLEPNYHEVAAQIRRDGGLSGEQREWAETLVTHPEDDSARNQLFASVKQDALLAGSADTASDAKLQPATHKLADALKDIEVPGRYRKVGPSLRYVDSKVGYDWLFSWIRQPSDFRPSTRMPQFFGQYEHLSEADDKDGLDESLRFEPIEIRAISEYLLKSSDKFTYLDAPQEVTEQASAERGKKLFQTRGCLACHSQVDFPGIAADQGPNLTGLSGKLNNEKGRKWLYSWIKLPNRYHSRTRMPILFLDPITEKDAQGKPTGKITDPAADIVAYLLGEPSDWKPHDVPSRTDWSEADVKALEDLAVEWLKSDTIPRSRAQKYVTEGVPEAQASKLKADDRGLVGLTAANRNERLVEMVARHTIGKYGCYGCHDIPGFEDAKPIGTGLVDWGRKESSKLAFENIHKFLEMHGIDPENPVVIAKLGGVPAPPPKEVADKGEFSAAADEPGEVAEHGEPESELDPGAFSAEDGYFVQSINSHARDGFLWQKLRYPRSYDYKTTRNKGWNERTRMPRFPFSDEPEELSEVMTFVLGLVKEPPAAKYLYKPTGRQQAINDGRQVLERFNCAGCHTLKMEQWEFAYADGTFEAPSEVVDFPFLAPRFTDKEIAASKAKDARGLLHASIHGLPVIDEESGQAGWVDEDRQPITKEELVEAEAEEGAQIPIFYRFTQWRNSLLNGEAHLRGVEELLVPANRDQYGPALGAAFPAWGGDLARYLFPKVIAAAKATNPQVNGKEAWGWLPPPLMDEGKKVQPDWLHEFLLDPTPIRPAAVMRMPNFHMSSDEAAKLVNFFAANSDAEFPYEARPQQRASHLAELRNERPDPLGEAMQIVVNGNYCVKCHSVGDFKPQGDPNTFGPNLANVSRRLRPEFVRNWIANPVRVLPYTGMPVNIPYRPDDPNLGGVSQQLFHGTSLQQLAGLVDLVMNFDSYAWQQTSVTPLVEKAAAAAAQAGSQGPGGGASAGETPAAGQDQASPPPVTEERDLTK